jgi:hypothetical protein
MWFSPLYLLIWMLIIFSDQAESCQRSIKSPQVYYSMLASLGLPTAGARNDTSKRHADLGVAQDGLDVAFHWKPFIEELADDVGWVGGWVVGVLAPCGARVCLCDVCI